MVRQGITGGRCFKKKKNAQKQWYRRFSSDVIDTMEQWDFLTTFYFVHQHHGRHDSFLLYLLGLSENDL